jgi:hypothetical protein
MTQVDPSTLARLKQVPVYREAIDAVEATTGAIRDQVVRRCMEGATAGTLTLDAALAGWIELATLEKVQRRLEQRVKSAMTHERILDMQPGNDYVPGADAK